MLDYLSTRRVFLQRGMTMLAASATIPAFLNNTVMAITPDGALTQAPTGKDGKILVVVQLSGGNDGLNTVVPFGDDAYYRARANIAHEARTVLKLDDYMGLHPNLAPIRELLDQNMMSIIQGVGYPNPNRSHFRSMDIWHSAEPEREVVSSGWIGRFFDNACPGCDPHVGLAVGDQLPVAMRGNTVTPLSFDKPDNYRYNGPDVERYKQLNMVTSSKEDGGSKMADGQGRNSPSSILQPRSSTPITPDSQLEFLTRTAMDAQLSSDAILNMTRAYSGTQYPNSEFGQGLRTVAAMIKGNLPTRVYYVSLGGFDTHAGERGRHDQLMTQFAAGVSSFWKDMKDQKNDQRVLMMTFSEFGRRVASNASGGTDHGAAAPMFLFGPSCKQAIVGKHPSLTDLDGGGDIKYAIDFRNVYASILQNWLETPSKPILGQQFNPMPVIKA